MLVVYILLGLIALILLVAAIAGTGWKFQKSIRINAPLDKVWDHVRTLDAINQWNPWIEQDPGLRQEITGTDGTPGATYSWASKVKNVGEGHQTIVSVREKTELALRIQFIKPFKGLADGYIQVAADGAATIATWGIVSSTPYPMNIIKVFGVIEKNMERDFGKGLNKLKALCEN